MKALIVTLALGVSLASAYSQTRREATSGGHMNAAAPAAGPRGPGAPDRPPWEVDSTWISYDHNRALLQEAAKKNRVERSEAALAESLGRPANGTTNSVATLDKYYRNQGAAMAKYANVVRALTETYIQKAIKENDPPGVINRLRGQQNEELGKYHL